MTNTSCLHWVPQEKNYRSTLLALSTDAAYINIDTRIVDLAQAFADHLELSAVGVTTSDGQVLGLISRAHLFGLLAKPFGRDVLSRKKVDEVIETCPSFSIHQNIYAVSDELGDTINDTMLRHFLIHGTNNEFKGVFSSKDLLVYLSRITREDIVLASRLQDRMVKAEMHWTGKHWSAHAFTRSALGLGGDFYFHKELTGGKHFFALGDVSGKGVAASILTSLLWGTLRSWDYDRGLKNLLEHLNLALIETFELEKYLTGFFMVYNEHKQTLQFADMGHGHGGLIRKNKVKSLQPPTLNLPLGIETHIDPKIYRLELKPGDLITLWTDGITEQKGQNGEEFGEQRLADLILTHRNDCEKLPLELHSAVEKWRAKLPQQDDLTWLQLCIN